MLKGFRLYLWLKMFKVVLLVSLYAIQIKPLFYQKQLMKNNKKTNARSNQNFIDAKYANKAI